MIQINIIKHLLTDRGPLDLDLDLNLSENKIIVIYGKSGVGKTTFLRILSGLSNPDAGTIKVGDKEWFNADSNINFKPQKRKIGYVFQDYALFPHLSTRKNIEFGLNNTNTDQVNKIIDMVDLKELENRMPHTLSGGQQQRVALARAMAINPNILLLDEPLSALDLDMRIKLQNEIKNIHQQFKTTIFLVTHDIPEIFNLAQQVIILDGGKVIQQGTPQEVFLVTKAEKSFQLIATVISIKENSTAQVQIGQQIIEIELNLVSGNKIIPGEKVLITSDNFNPKIIKLKN